jgi:2,4-dienoyl-CoA reductase-like NADH-dependent reductase (Old Yellow Enzyme family)
LVKGDLTLDESVQFAQRLNEAGIDLREVSGGSYEQLEFSKPKARTYPQPSQRQASALMRVISACSVAAA